MAYLPAPLRKSVLARVQGASLLDAQAVQYTRADGSVFHTVSVLCINGNAGICVLASRQEGATMWQARQAAYSFASQYPMIEGLGHGP